MVSSNRLRAVCKSIQNQLRVENDGAYFERYLHPLIGIGLIECQPNNKFALAPTIILKGKSQHIGINLPKNSLESTKCTLNLYNEHLVWFDKIAGSEGTIIKKIDPKAISKLPRFIDLVSTWELHHPSDKERSVFQKLSKKGWYQEPKTIAGVFKGGENRASNRYLFYEGKWRKLPSYNLYPDIQRVAYTLTSNKADCFVFNSKNQSLNVKAYMFPLIILRILFHVSEFEFRIHSNGDYSFKNINAKGYNKLLNKLYGKDKA